uniref:Uncharacterized protein n=1 Tax=Arundo donax TaxID=35708 RepID=A0A0A9B0J4_ARUDO
MCPDTVMHTACTHASTYPSIDRCCAIYM